MSIYKMLRNLLPTEDMKLRFDAEFARRVKSERGAIGLGLIAMLAFLAVFAYNVIPIITAGNAVVQADTNASTTTKTMADLGEWAIPAGILIALAVVGFKHAQAGEG